MASETAHFLAKHLRTFSAAALAGAAEIIALDAEAIAVAGYSYHNRAIG